MTALTPRRTVLTIGAAGAAAALTGCTVYGRDDDGGAADTEPADETGGEAGGQADEADRTAGNGDVLAAASDIEVGGGLILADQGVVVTQPRAGEFNGFTSTCTHQGCTVTSVSDNTINCPCHGSRFSIEDGSVVQAAAGLTPETQDPLPEVAVTVDGDAIRLA